MKHSLILLCTAIMLHAGFADLYGQVHKVYMRNYKFDPQELHIEPGDTVIWQNDTRVVHTATGGSSCREDGTFNSGNVKENETFQFVFDSSGTYPYFCIPHCEMDMTGVVYVGSTDTTEIKEYVEIFYGTRVISGHSVETLRKRFLDFRVAHRWDDMAVSRTGGHQLWGIDNMRDLRLAFEYGITDNFMIGAGRSKGDCCNGAQSVKELIDVFGKYQFFKQHPEKLPFSLSAYVNTAFTIMKSVDIDGNEANLEVKSERFSYVGQVLAARKFFDKLSLQVMPTYVRRNWAVMGNEKDLFALGAAGKYMFSDLFGLILEYYHVFDEFRNEPEKIYYNPIGLAAEFHVGLHVFHVNLTNSAGLIPNTFIPYTTDNWMDGEFRLGFSISRKFHL